MIRVKNLQHHIIPLNVSGTLSTTGAIAGFSQAVGIVPFAGFISNIYAKVVAGQNGTYSTTVNIGINGVSIYGSGTAMSLSGTTGTVTHGTLSTDPPAVAAGDIINLAVTSPSANPPLDLSVLVTITRGAPSAMRTLSDHSTLI